MNFFARMALNRAAQRYSRLLAAELEADWGASDTYPPGHIAATLDRREGIGRYAAIAYAAFLTENDYLAIAPSLPFAPPYAEAREIFQRGHAWGNLGALATLESRAATNDSGKS